MVGLVRARAALQAGILTSAQWTKAETQRTIILRPTAGARQEKPRKHARAGGDRDGKIQGQERFAALRLGADNPDGPLRAQILDPRPDQSDNLELEAAHHRLVAKSSASAFG